jgi:hypothetical protein
MGSMTINRDATSEAWIVVAVEASRIAARQPAGTF